MDLMIPSLFAVICFVSSAYCQSQNSTNPNDERRTKYNRWTHIDDGPPSAVLIMVIAIVVIIPVVICILRCTCRHCKFHPNNMTKISAIQSSSDRPDDQGQYNFGFIPQPRLCSDAARSSFTRNQ